jgi:hypothetical protein
MASSCVALCEDSPFAHAVILAVVPRAFLAARSFLFNLKAAWSNRQMIGQAFQIPRGKFILGRETDCHLVLDSNSVSRHHCVLLLDDYTRLEGRSATAPRMSALPV